MKERSFLGTGWAFPPSFKKDGEQTAMVSNEEDIRQSIMILLTTKPGERIHRPEYGCGIHTMVFEIINTTTLTIIEDLISKAILMYEPRITLNSVSFDHSEEYEGILTVLLDYTVRLTNTRSNMVFPFYFKEGTNLRLNE